MMMTARPRSVTSQPPTGREAAAAGKYTPHIRKVREEKKACDRSKGHKPRRWVVERTFSWIDHTRRMSKDYERLTETSEAFIYVAMSRLMVRRLARS